MWGYAKPNNYSGYQACAVLAPGVSFKFDDEDCHGSISRYVCERSEQKANIVSLRVI